MRDLIYQRAKELIANGHSGDITMGSWPFIRLKERRELILPQEVRHTEEEKETDCWSSLIHVKTELKKPDYSM